LGCFHFLTSMNDVAMNIFFLCSTGDWTQYLAPDINNWGQSFVCTYVFIFPGYTGRSGIATSYSNSMFSVLKNYQTIFQSGCAIFHPYQQCMRVLISLYSCQYLFLSVFLISAIPEGVKW
jgi:hypothetical protein